MADRAATLPPPRAASGTRRAEARRARTPDGTDPVARRTSSEEEVRDVVRRVVDRLLDARSPGAGPNASAAPSGPGADASPAPTREAAGPGAIALGADHGGLRLKDLIAHELSAAGWTVDDCGTTTADPVDYPDFAHAVARLVADGTCTAGIVVDGAGIGSCMAANKVPGIRAALCYDVSSARNSREHNHANVLTLGGRLIGDGLALEIVKTWLATPWGGGRHQARVDKIGDIERRYLREPVAEGAR